MHDIAMGNKVMGFIPLVARRLREARGWTQQQLSLRGGLNQGYLSEVERNERNWSMSWLLALAASLGVEWWELFGYTHPPDAELPEATRELVHRVVQLDERGVGLVRAVVEQAEQMGMVRREGQSR